MNTMIPTKVIESILEHTSKLDSTHKQKIALQKILIELWLFIYDKQISAKEFTSLSFFTNIHNKKLSHFKIKIAGITINYNQLINTLESINLIAVNRVHSQNKFSFGYKILTSIVATGHYTEVDLNIDRVFSNIRPKKHWLDLYPQHSHLIEDIYNTTIRLDDYLHYLLSNIGMPLHTRTVKKEVDGKKIQYTYQPYLSYEDCFRFFHMALKINIGNIWVAEFSTGRFASSVSNMSFTATKFYQFNKQKLVDIDIKNSQPLLLSLLIDCPEYKKDVEDGVFYDNMAKEICEMKGEVYDEEIHRCKFKIQSYRFIFYNDKPLNGGFIFKAMNRLYPGAIGQINALKADGTLAGRMQRIEADIFVDYIGSVNINKLLRHDQVLVKPQHKEMIEQLLKTKYAELGLRVSF